MKQTAVEWLVEQIFNDVDLKDSILKLAINQAKEMEKEQIIKAHGDKLKNSQNTGNYEYWFSGKDYYNETFKKTEQ